MRFRKTEFAVFAVGLLMGGGILGFLLLPSPADPVPGGGVNREPSSNEISSFKDLESGYHAGLTDYGFMELSDSLEIDRQGLGNALGMPQGCSAAPSTPLRTRSETLPEGELHWFAGEAECDGFSLPWNTVVGVPANQVPKGVLILVHGTASSPEHLFGIQTGSYHRDYVNGSGLIGLSDGFVVLAPRILTDLVYDDQAGYNDLRNRVDRRAQALGMRLLGMEQATLTHSINSVVDKLELHSLNQVIYGVSLGGLVAFYQAALNPEIDAVIVSQWAENRFNKLAGPTDEWAMWRFEYGDYSIIDGAALKLRDRDVAELIFPRPFSIEVGEEDPRATSMIPLVDALSKLYAEYPERLQVAVNPGGHEMKYYPVVEKTWEQIN